MLGNTVSAAVAAGFATAKDVAIAYYDQYTEIYAEELRLAKLGCIAVVGATAYTMAVVSAYCTGELLGLPRGWVGLLFRGIATSRTAWLVYGLVGGGYATAGYVLGFDRVKNLIRKALHQVLPGYASQDAIQEQDIFVVLKGGKVWHEPLGGGPVSGPLEIPLLDVNTAAAFEYDGEVFAISSDGKLSKPLLARGTNDPERPFADLPGMSSRIYAMMDWSTQAVFIYNNRIYLIKDGKVFHDDVNGRNFQGPDNWALVDNNCQGAYMANGRFYVFKGGRVYHEKIGETNGTYVGPEEWDIIDDTVQDVFIAHGRVYVIKGGVVWHEKLGGSDLQGPEKYSYVDWTVQACWMQGNRVFVVRNGKLEHFYFPPPRQEGKQPSPAKKLTSIFSNRGSKKESASIPQDWVDGDCFFDSASQGGGASSVGQKPSPPTNQQAGSPHQQEDPQAVVNSKRLPQDPTPIPPGPGIQAAWTYGKWLYMVRGGKVYAQEVGGGEQRGPMQWSMVDETVQAAYVHSGRLYVIKAGGVYHASAGHSVSGSTVGPEKWPLVDASVQAALISTDMRLGVAQFVTSGGMPVYALNESATSRLLADIVLAETRSLDLAQQIAAASQSNHVTGALLAKYTILDFCQDFGMNAPIAKAVSTKIREYCRTGVPMSLVQGRT